MDYKYLNKMLSEMDKKLALVVKDVSYMRKEIEGNGKKGLIQKVDDVETEHRRDVASIKAFQNKLIGGFVAIQIAIGLFIKFF